MTSSKLPAALAKLRDKATAGDPRAALKLGDGCYRGEKIAEDFAAARDWYVRAAELGNVDAMVNLVYFCSKGDGARWTQPAQPAPVTAVELEQALRWAVAASAQGKDQTPTIAALQKQLAGTKATTKAKPGVQTARTQRAALKQLIASAKLTRIATALEKTRADSIRLALGAAPPRASAARGSEGARTFRTGWRGRSGRRIRFVHRPDRSRGGRAARRDEAPPRGWPPVLLLGRDRRGVGAAS